MTYDPKVTALAEKAVEIAQFINQWPVRASLVIAGILLMFLPALAWWRARREARTDKLPEPRRTNTYNGQCPGCGHVFTLAELKEMAVGDGWQRYLHVRKPDGEIEVVSFDVYVPGKMTLITDAALKQAIADGAKISTRPSRR